MQDLSCTSLTIQLTDTGVRVGDALKIAWFDHLSLPPIDDVGIMEGGQRDQIGVAGSMLTVCLTEGVELLMHPRGKVRPVVLHLGHGMTI